MTGKAYLEPDPAQFALYDRDRSPVERGYLSNDRQAEPAAAGIAVARRLQTHESIENVLTLCGLDAGAIVIDAQHDVSIALTQ